MRSIVRDVLVPGQRVSGWLVEHAQRHSLTELRATANEEPAASNQHLHQIETTLRHRELRIVELQNQLAQREKLGRFPFASARSERLVLPELLQARILSHDGTGTLISSLVIDKGLTHQTATSQIVLETTAPVIDQGELDNLKTGQSVYAGRCVIGRIDETGHWTSSLQLITHAEYSGRARLARRTSAGLTFGTEGIVEGTGDGLCRLTGIPDTQSVAVGDEVFTGGRSPVLSDPMYYGRIVQADLRPGSTWDIIVRPPWNVESLTEVVVLRASLNPVRILGQ
jgi:rod shape-determining protein MreC